jgi:hypothetical protein
MAKVVCCRMGESGGRRAKSRRSFFLALVWSRGTDRGVVAEGVAGLVAGVLAATEAQDPLDAGVVAPVVGRDGGVVLPFRWESRVLSSILAIWLASLCSSGESLGL